MRIRLSYIDGFYDIEVSEEESMTIEFRGINLIEKYKNHKHTPYESSGKHIEWIVIDDIGEKK